MKRLVLVHWNEAEAAERAAFLRKAGYRVDWPGLDGGAVTRGLARRPPDALVIDLRRLPSHGRAVAVWVRERRALRHLPLVFVEGDAAKTARLKEALPDAVFTPWPRVRSAIRRALAAPVMDPVVPAGPDYSGTPLARKLGIKSGSRIALIGAPRGFDDTLGELPGGVEVGRQVRGELDVVLLFCRTLGDLQRSLPRARRVLAPRGGLWVAWPKKGRACRPTSTKDWYARRGSTRASWTARSALSTRPGPACGSRTGRRDRPPAAEHRRLRRRRPEAGNQSGVDVTTGAVAA